MSRRAGATIAALVAVLAGSRPARGGDTPAPSKDQIRYSLPVDLSITGAFFAETIVVQALDLAPDHCHWCDTPLNGLDDGARDALRWSNPRLAGSLSNVTGYAMVPLFGVVGVAVAADRDRRIGETPINMLLVAEAAVVDASIVQLTKIVAGRERPDAHALSPAERAKREPNNTSFYSGHTSFSWAVATSSGMVATLRGYRWAPLVWIGGLTFAGATAYLRVAADRHYLTDTLAGAATGALVGFSLPYIFHRKHAEPKAQAWLPSGIVPGNRSIGLAWNL